MGNLKRGDRRIGQKHEASGARRHYLTMQREVDAPRVRLFDKSTSFCPHALASRVPSGLSSGAGDLGQSH